VVYIGPGWLEVKRNGKKSYPLSILVLLLDHSEVQISLCHFYVTVSCKTFQHVKKSA
jgi:hypothetical protein